MYVENLTEYEVETVGDVVKLLLHVNTLTSLIIMFPLNYEIREFYMINLVQSV